MQQFEVKDIPILRGYQNEAEGQIKHNFKAGHNKQILLFPTGGGKTVVFCNTTHRTLSKSIENKVLILTHRKELFAQASKTLGKYGIQPGYLNADTKNKDIPFSSRCLVAMAETYERRLKKFPVLAEYNLIIIDECHMGNFKKIFHLWEELGFPNQRVIGCTATPISTSKRDPLKNYYTELVCPVSIEELIELGSLVPCVTRSADLINRSQIVKDSKSEDGFYDQSQMQQFDRKQVYDGLIDKFREVGLDNAGKVRKTIVFNINVKHSKNVCQSFIDAGFRAVHVDGTMSDEERTAAFVGFEGDEYDILCNVNIATAGYDYPPTSVVVINKATNSVSFWLQACGRGSRPAEGKDKFYVLDMASNWVALRVWSAHRDWRSLFFRDPRQVDSDGPPAKLCPECMCINNISAKRCADCGYEFPAPEEAPPENPDFIDIVDGMASGLPPERMAIVSDILQNRTPFATLDVPVLIDVAKVKSYSMGWVLQRLLQRSNKDEVTFRAEVQQVADWKGYKQGWVKMTVERYSSHFSSGTNDESNEG